MADEDVQINIKSKADNKGIEASKNKLQDLSKVAALVNKELAKTGTKAEASGKKAEGAFTKLGKQIEKCTSVVGKFSAVFNAFGFVSLVTGVITKFEELAKWIDDCRTRSARFQAELRFKSLQEEVDKLTGSYKKLQELITKSDVALSKDEALEDRRKQVKRQNEDAQLNLREAQELATVSDSDPDAAQKRTLIANKYATQRAKVAETRANEDRQTQYDRLYGQKYVGDYQAQLIDEKAAEDEKLAEDLDKEAARYHMNPEKQKQLLEQASQKRKDARAKRAQSKELREQGKEAVATAEEFYAGTDTTAALVRQTAEANLKASNTSANSQIATRQQQKADAARTEQEKRAQEEAERKTKKETAKNQMSLLERQILEAEAGLAGAQGAKEQNTRELFAAKKDLALGRGSEEVVQKEASELAASIDDIKSFADLLKDLNKQLATVKKQVAENASRGTVSADYESVGD